MGNDVRNGESINLHKKTEGGELDVDPVHFKSTMSSSEEAVSWKGPLPQTGLPSLSSPGSWSEPVMAHCPSGLASAGEGLSKELDVILEERGRWERIAAKTTEGARWLAVSSS